MTTQNHDPAVDEYIANAQPFAQPILSHLRGLIHQHCPAVEEAIKWGLPHFDHAGEMMCILSSHKAHCSFSFWKESIMSDERLRANPELPAAKRFMGRITSLADLPGDEVLGALLQEAVALNEKGVKLPPREPKTPQDIAIPEAFAEQLAADPAAKAVFESKSPSFRKDYLVWITDAKTDATRDKRIAESLAWIAEGKGRFWRSEER
jgi:uncharacterized protein YdeI (YjbR/CyaY-like superfamily)